MSIILDSNIFFSAIIKNAITREIITKSKQDFLMPLIVFEEFKKYKEEIIRKSGLDYLSFRQVVIKVMKYIKLVKDKQFENYFKEALTIMKDIDEKDAIFIACALAFNCPVWSNDPHFKRQNKVKTFTTKEILNFLKDSK